MPDLKLATLALLGAALAACTVGPDYVRPTPALPAHFAQAPHAAGDDARAGDAGGAGSAAAAPADAEFWRSFDDALLTRLVDGALRANNDLRVALANYDRANALLRESGFDRFPTVTAGADASDALASAGQMPGVPRSQRDGRSYSAEVGVTWELDLFGRVRRSIEAQRADTRASAADLRALQVAIVGEVAASYVGLRGLQEQLRVAHANADNQRNTLRLVDARVSAGRGTEFDSSRARAQLETTLSRVPALQAEVAVQMHRLAVLTGKTPDTLIQVLEAPAPLPALPARIAAGTPGELLRRRPDIAAAEQRLHAATARIGVATADLFPRFTLGGLIGSQAIDGSALFERDSETHLAALGIDWSFLDIGRVRARIAATDAEAAANLARYRQTVLLALEDTENAMVRLAHARSEDRHLEQAAGDSARAAELARTRFDAGATGLLDVLDAERSRLQAEDAFAQGRTRAVAGAIALYKALAGGWPQRIRRTARPEHT
ncbi:MAG TPA: efflux transporter outer membrane subunit [Rhodanobacteraceae bacterium]|nr:efflux transporter outer membrane subunit [Rhodanobacteraceae bacterium]